MKKNLLKSVMFCVSFFMLFSATMNAQQIKHVKETRASFSALQVKELVTSKRVNFDFTQSRKDFSQQVGSVNRNLNQYLTTKTAASITEDNIRLGGYLRNDPMDLGSNFYTFDPNSAASDLDMEQVGSDLGQTWMLSGASDGTYYYAIIVDPSTQQIFYTVYDLVTWEVVKKEPKSLIIETPDYLVYDPIEKQMYGICIFKNQDESEFQLIVKFNLEKGTGEFIDEENPNNNIIPWTNCLYVDSSNGEMYGIADLREYNDGSVYISVITMDRTTYGSVRPVAYNFFKPEVTSRYFYPRANGFYVNNGIFYWNALVHIFEEGAEQPSSTLYIRTRMEDTGTDFTFNLIQAGTAEEVNVFTGLFTPIDISSGINEEEKADGINIYPMDGSIVVEGAEAQSVLVYSIDGRQVFNGMDTTIPVSQGIYVVKVADKVEKVIVK